MKTLIFGRITKKIREISIKKTKEKSREIYRVVT